MGGVASVMMLLQLSYLSFSWESMLHVMCCYSEMMHRQNFNIVHGKPCVLSSKAAAKDYFYCRIISGLFSQLMN